MEKCLSMSRTGVTVANAEAMAQLAEGLAGAECRAFRPAGNVEGATRASLSRRDVGAARGPPLRHRPWPAYRKHGQGTRGCPALPVGLTQTVSRVIALVQPKVSTKGAAEPTTAGVAPDLSQRATCSIVVSACGPFRPHSQTTAHRHPARASSSSTTRSRFRFASNFAIQKSVRVAGTVVYRQSA